VPFCLPNALAKFQSNIDDCVRAYIDDFAVCHLDDILIYSTNETEHNGHIQKVLERLREFALKLQGREVSIRSLSGRLPWECHQF